MTTSGRVGFDLGSSAGCLFHCGRARRMMAPFGRGSISGLKALRATGHCAVVKNTLSEFSADIGGSSLREIALLDLIVWARS